MFWLHYCCEPRMSALMKGFWKSMREVMVGGWHLGWPETMLNPTFAAYLVLH